MTKLFVTARDGEVRTVVADPNRTLMELIRESGVNDLLALCGGCCSCATCHVYVDPAFADRLRPISEDEDAMLDGTSHREATSRLSCQIRGVDLLEGMRVTIAPED